jgi:putative flippase GtrA
VGAQGQLGARSPEYDSIFSNQAGDGMTVIVRNERERSRFLRFMAVGVIGAIVDFGTFNLLSGPFHVLPIIAQLISFSCAVVSNFTINRYWTYPDSRSKKLEKQVVQFLIVSVIGLLIRTPIFASLETPLANLFSSISRNLPVNARFLGHNGALAVAVGVVMMWNFFVNRYWTYNDVE